MSILESESTLTDRYQTTVPEAVRRALRLRKRDRIHYAIQADGVVVLTRAESAVEDQALTSFLAFLAADITDHPERLSAIDAELVTRMNALTDGMQVDLDADLSPDDE